jgi:glycosyltransferase involved in cell wall biosynthesis
MALIEVLIPTYRRKTGLAITLTSLLGQTFQDFRVVVSDQTPESEQYLDSIEIDTLAQALRWHGHEVELLRHLPARGLAEQRQFLLDHASAPFVHYLDDDVLLDPPVMERMLTVMEHERCGFVGCAATGLRFLGDHRPQQEHLEPWIGRVRPEPFGVGSIPWDRHLVNNAANPLHLEERLLQPGEILRYKVAWIGGANVLYDRRKLLDIGGFSFWPRLPVPHAGEEVLVQFLLIRRHGGCGILPSGTYHLGLPTSVEDRTHNATSLFEDLVRELEHQPQSA